MERHPVADEAGDKKKRGARGGVKHTPGRDHARKSAAQKKKQFQRKAAQKRKAEQEHLQKRWQEWDALPPEVQKLRPDMKPKQPRPTDEG
jgi:hypothetical protein